MMPEMRLRRPWWRGWKNGVFATRAMVIKNWIYLRASLVKRVVGTLQSRSSLTSLGVLQNYDTNNELAEWSVLNHACCCVTISLHLSRLIYYRKWFLSVCYDLAFIFGLRVVLCIWSLLIYSLIFRFACCRFAGT